MQSVTTATLLGLLLSAAPAQLPIAAPAQVGPSIAHTDGLALAILEADTRAVLRQIGVDGELTSRVKDPRSLAAKAQRKGIPEHAVLDRLALRVKVDTESDCYRVMNTLTERFSVVPGSTDDYIAAPKANGYRSLHAAVHTPIGIAEFQVRTHEMHHHAEYGDAAHDVYKAGQAQVG